MTLNRATVERRFGHSVLAHIDCKVGSSLFRVHGWMQSCKGELNSPGCGSINCRHSTSPQLPAERRGFAKRGPEPKAPRPEGLVCFFSRAAFPFEAQGFQPGTLERSLARPEKPRQTELLWSFRIGSSIETITDLHSPAPSPALDYASPSKQAHYSYDPWGERRDPGDWVGLIFESAIYTHAGHDDLALRGFTGHEMMDDFKLVHMNGRIYDPLLGRFLSADIQVDGVFTLQGYNRYSYVANNPLSYDDKSGYGKGKAAGSIFKWASRKAGKRTAKMMNTQKQLVRAFKNDKNIDIFANSAREAKQIAKKLNKGKTHRFRRDSGSIINGKKGMDHFQSRSYKGQHIFYKSIAALLGVGLASDDSQAEETLDDNEIELSLVDGVNPDVLEIFSDPYPGESPANALTVSHWVGEDSALRHLDWVNPLELVAMGGDLGRELGRQMEGELIGFAVNTFNEDGDAVNSFVFDNEGGLQSVSFWKDGEIVQTMGAEDFYEYLERLREERERQENEDG